MSGCRQHEIYTYSDVINDLKLQTNSMFAWHGHCLPTTRWAGKPMQTVRLGNSTLDASLYLKVFISGRYPRQRPSITAMSIHKR